MKVKAETSAPLTAFDWNDLDPSIIVTASVDTTCTVWDLNTAQARTQLIAHDKEVFDVTFTAGSTDIFASVGSDGSVRLFDLRSLEHSTIIYESPATSTAPAIGENSLGIPMQSGSPLESSPPALLRLSACQRDANYLATLAIDSKVVQILDIRQPGSPVLELDAHAASVNAVCWAPNSRNLIATCGDDSQVLVWDINNPGQANYGVNRSQDPVLAWTADSEVNNMSWNGDSDRIVATYAKSAQVIKI